MNSTKERVLGALDKAAGIAPELATELDWDQIEPTRLAPDFRDVVFARIAAEPTGTGQPRGPLPWWKKVAAGLMVFVVVGGTVWYVVPRGIEVSENQTPARGRPAYEDHLRILFDETEPVEKRAFAQTMIYRQTKSGVRALRAHEDDPGRVGRVATRAIGELRDSFQGPIPVNWKPSNSPPGTCARAISILNEPASGAPECDKAIQEILPVLRTGIHVLQWARNSSEPFAANSQIWLPEIGVALGR